ncbi:hypothetical protein RI367_001653 [Sorochytrium milnesiophthora]
MASCSVQVALRVRPLTAKETLQNCAECVAYVRGTPQVVIGADRSFTFDHVFAPECSQGDVYQCVRPLLERFVDGYNATVLAYGQTGSGKTFSMGTGLDAGNSSSGADPDIMGIVPRAVHDLYRLLRDRYPAPSKAQVFVSFLELYNEELVDLLNPTTTSNAQAGGSSQQNGGAFGSSRPATSSTRSDSALRIREDENGNIVWVGVREEECRSPEDIMGFLAKGSLCRTTGSTDMNMVSSRSHAIFSISVRIQKHVPAQVLNDDTAGNGPNGLESSAGDSYERLTAKFHFVDLAGSERLKRTNAEGTRAREGIAINSGLLALGNVISALGDEARLEKGVGHVPQTLMLACVSPADANFQETLNTLKYANRARNIKNRVVVNQEVSGNSVEVQQLRTQIARLKMELSAVREQYGAPAGSGGGISASPSLDNLSKVQEQQHQLNVSLRNKMSDLQTERSKLEFQIVQLQNRIKDLEGQLILVQAERDTLLMDKHGYRMPSQQPQTNGNDASPNAMQADPASATEPIVNPIISSYLTNITQLKAQLAEREMEVKFLKQQAALVASLTSSNLLPAANSAVDKPSAFKQFKFALPTQEEKREMNDIGETLEKARAQVKQDVALLLSTTTNTAAMKACPDAAAMPWGRENADTDRDDMLSMGDAWDKPVAPPNLDISLWTDASGEPGNGGAAPEATYKALHKIQADIAIKEELIVGLERTHNEYSVMKRNYEDKLRLLQDNLQSVQKERDIALQRMEKNPKEKEKDVRSKYEAKVRQLLGQISDLRRKHTDVTKNVSSSKNRNDYMIKQMRLSIEALKAEKQRLLKNMREDAERAREQTIVSEREIQQLRKREKAATEMAKKFERNYELQKLLLKRRSEEIVSSHSKLKSVMSLLKRSQTPKTISKSGAGAQSKRSSSTGGGGIIQRLEAIGVNQHADFSAPSAIQMSFKKSVLDKELEQVVAGQKTVQIMDELLKKRERLFGEKAELLAERDRVVIATATESNSEPDHAAPQYMDDRLELIDAEVNYLNARIKALQADVANGGSAQDSTPDGAVATQDNMDNILNVIRSLTHEESVSMLEMVLSDVVELRIHERTQQINVNNLEKTAGELRRSLMLMRNAAMSSAVEYEKKIKTMQIVDSQTANSSSSSLAPSRPYEQLLDVYGEGMFSNRAELGTAATSAPASAPAAGSAAVLERPVARRVSSPVGSIRHRSRKTSSDGGRPSSRSPDDHHDMEVEQVHSAVIGSPHLGLGSGSKERERSFSVSSSASGSVSAGSHAIRSIRRPNSATGNMDVFERLSKTYTVAAQAKVRDQTHRGEEGMEQAGPQHGLDGALTSVHSSMQSMLGREHEADSVRTLLGGGDSDPRSKQSAVRHNDVVLMDLDDPKA